MDRAKKYPENYPKIHVFNTFFFHMLETKGYKGVRRWTKKFDIFEKDYIIIPVHLGMHWCCAVIDFKQKKFIYYDSLHGNNPKCLRLLRQYVEDESMDKKGVPYDTSDWLDSTPKVHLINQDIPAQENGYDCGVFTCMFMDFTAREEPFAFRQKHMPYLRKRMASEIIHAELIAIKNT
jgi:sentrin-specific protease 1